MNLKFDRELLISKLKLSASFIPKKAVLPAYTLILFEVEKGVVKLTAQNGEMQMINTCSVLKSDGDGKFTVPGVMLLQTISLMKEPEVTISYKDGKCTIKSGKSKYKMSSDDGKDHIRMERVKATNEASFAGAVINSALETSLKYATKKNPNAAFQGVCLRMGDNTINFLSSNQASVSKIEVAPRSINTWSDIVIPEETCKAIIKCVNDIDIVDIVHSKNAVEITAGEIVIISSVIDSKFPDIDVFFKKKPSESIELNTVEFIHAIQRLSLVANEEAPSVLISIKTGGLLMSTNDEAYGNSGDEEVACIAKHEADIVFGLTILKNIIESFDNDMFTMSYSDIGNPVFFDPIENINGNNKFFLMATMK